ncbi:hypothetical protein HMPREF0742_02573 [Rothia aeria F0184]|uniref:Uncharacterized protein n=1 Tax=Rothia aeria F0184 TaxID=888019 RepID=U7UWR7_9MICC|nr:hypothetical protein HMPREF0742_02573 [Rothia aeria F0184]
MLIAVAFAVSDGLSGNSRSLVVGCCTPIVRPFSCGCAGSSCY